MAEFQPPEGLLREIALKMCSAEPGTSTEVAGTKVVHGFHGSDKPCQWCLFDAERALAALFEACEVREERRIVIDDERCAGLPINGLWVVPPAMADTHKSLLGRYSSARMERRFVIETPPEPPSTGEEKTDRG